MLNAGMIAPFRVGCKAQGKYVCMEDHCGIWFCALSCLEYEVSADHTSDLQDILP